MPQMQPTDELDKAVAARVMQRFMSLAPAERAHLEALINRQTVGAIAFLIGPATAKLFVDHAAARAAGATSIGEHKAMQAGMPVRRAPVVGGLLGKPAAAP